MSTPSRQPAGVPIGGQFAAKSNPESDLDLEPGPRKSGFEVGEMMMNGGMSADDVRQYALTTEATSIANLESERFGAAAEVNLEFAKGIMAAADAGEDAAWAGTVAADNGKSKAQVAAEEEAHPSGFMARSAPAPVLNRSDEPPEPGPMSSTSPEVQAGKVYDTVVVESAGYSTTFHRRRDGVFADWPYAMRLQANRPLTDDEARQFAGLVGYAYRSTIAGESIGMPEQDTPYSFVVSADMTKTQRDDLGMALEDFENTLPGTVRDGSPVRKTDRAGSGTKGTRLVEGLGEGLRFEVYYDSAGSFGTGGDWVSAGEPTSLEG
jgi:hypothetical protein